MALKVIIPMIISLSLLLCGCVTTSQAKMPNYEARKSYVETHSELAVEIKQAILKGKVIEGMTKQDVLVAWGEPSKIHRYSEHKRLVDETDENTHDESWLYDQPFYSFAPRKFVRFGTDGIVNYVSVYYN
ncbi:MAG: hypothetical protein NTU54_06355 [Candidatus Omnitrophica bacterium]|nr:hypothetical protein [Candidatus Omnitrophota bacterium]